MHMRKLLHMIESREFLVNYILSFSFFEALYRLKDRNIHLQGVPIQSRTMATFSETLSKGAFLF